ncbi:MAG: gamma-glutamyl-gamma-aminobutyrate hydrolase family protein [Phycisphaeraceae bacterium]|nr:gamma-glutamyl-gamma-aminobutyrate hydrolase family protein [Phycisphaeraceae bacterium]
MTQTRIIIGVLPDLAEPRPGSPRMECAMAYADAIVRAGGVPVVLPPVVELIPSQLELCRGVVLTGGDDPRTEMFGEPTHSMAKPMHSRRQEYEVALLRALESRPDVPVLGVCLGMQLMALCAGGRLNQHMPDDVPTAADHAGNAQHPLRIEAGDHALSRCMADGGGQSCPVTSHHRQAVRDAGRLRVVARAPDGVIEAIDDPARPFYLGVQWHPERTAHAGAGLALFEALVAAARGA